MAISTPFSTPDDNSLASRLHAVRSRLHSACQAAGRDSAQVGLLCVSKTQPAEAIRTLHSLGERHFGENYLQEALDKIAALHDLRCDLTWHLIGPLQSNKTRLAAEAFDWVHSVDRFTIAQRLSEQRPANKPPLQVCLQVNVSGETSKSGVSPAELPSLAHAIAALPRLQLRGLMSIPAPAKGPDAQRAPHRQLRALQSALNAEGLVLDSLSMGMSADLEAAVAEGATWVRIGSAIFGERPVKA